MSDTDEPKNELEQRLLDVQEGRLAGDDFVRELLAAQVFVPVHEDSEISGFQRSAQAQPLTVHTEDGLEVLVLFSSPDRARPFLQDFPGVRGGLLVPFQSALEKVGEGYGIAINPGWELGMDFEPEMVQQLRAMTV